MAPEIHMLKQFKGDSIMVRNGELIEIPADVLGLPIPKIEWSKDDVVIEKPTDTLLMETEVTGRMNCKTKLSIPAANRKDRGSYAISASNNMGSAKHTISVMVLGELRPNQQQPISRKNIIYYRNKYTNCILFFRPATSTPECDGVQHQGRVLLPPLGPAAG